MCTATRTSSYSPIGPSVFFYIFSNSNNQISIAPYASYRGADLCFACLIVLFDLFVSPFFYVSLSS